MKRFLTIAAAAALIIGVSLPAAAINPFGTAAGQYATAAESMTAADSDGYQEVASDVSSSAASLRDSFDSEAKPAPPPPKPQVLASSYSGPILDAWKGMLTTWPVPGAKLGVGFTSYHDGLDFLAASGTPIHASADGTVVKVGTLGSMGDMVQIDHGSGIQTIYGHMLHGSQTVVAGQFVHAGDIIGYVGQTGSATTPHCHLGVFVNGRAVNPAPFLGL